MKKNPKSWLVFIRDEVANYYHKHGVKPTEIMVSKDVMWGLINEFAVIPTLDPESKILGMDVFEVSNRTNFVRLL